MPELLSPLQPPLEVKVQTLCNAAIYPEVVERVETMETHFAWIFLTEQHAYKLKKPVRVDRMDHRSLSSRYWSCLEELRLNRRLAPDVYLDVVPLTMDAEGELHLGERGSPVEWLVKMRRLKGELLLDHAMTTQSVTPGTIYRVGRLLADFYCRQPSVQIGPQAYCQRLNEQIESNRRELLAPDLLLPSDRVKRVASIQQDALKTTSRLLAERAERGKIIEAHGDLRPEHIYLGYPPCVIDCLEFERDLRLLDPAEELAFLFIECEQAGHAWIGKQVLDVYRTVSGDTFSPALFQFYSSRRATHRAMIIAWHLRDVQVRDNQDWRALAIAYLDKAFEYASHAQQPR